jgi:hypothetical protein
VTNGESVVTELVMTTIEAYAICDFAEGFSGLAMRRRAVSAVVREDN